MPVATTASAYARVGLLGNPSDAYGGKAIAFSLANFRARVWLEEDSSFCIEPASPGGSRWPSILDAAQPLRAGEGDDGERLIRAALRRLLLRFPAIEALDPGDARHRARLRYETNVPRQVGLSGSSALVIASLRGLLAWLGCELSNDELAALALAAEVEELGIAAGPMDRLIQAHEGCMWMDFGDPTAHGPLDPALLPALFVAWDPKGGASSAIVHRDIRARFQRGDKAVREAMAVFPTLVDEALACLARGDHARFAELMDRNFDTRAAIWQLAPRDHELVSIGRDRGHAVKQTGSGGAVVGVLSHEADFAPLERAYREAGYCAIRPSFVPGSE